MDYSKIEHNGNKPIFRKVLKQNYIDKNVFGHFINVHFFKS